MFGLVLTVISFGILALTTNLVAAFLTLLAVGFYVVVYTMLLKRSTPQNIVLGGAAGALPPAPAESMMPPSRSDWLARTPTGRPSSRASAVTMLAA